MKLYRIYDMIEDHQKGKIRIKKISSEHGTLIDNIEVEGILKYENFMVTYIDPLGNASSIADTNRIDHIEYTINEYKYDGNFNNGLEEEVTIAHIDPIPFIRNNNEEYEKPKYYKYPDKHISSSYIQSMDGVDVIHPGVFEWESNDELVYNAELGKLYKGPLSKFEGAYTKSSGYESHLDEGYVTIEDGLLEMKIFIPESDYEMEYEMRILSGNHLSNSTLNKVIVNGVSRYSRTKTNMEFLWQDSPLEYFGPTEDDFSEVGNIKLDSGEVNTIKISYDSKFSTKFNDIDAIVLIPKVVNTVPNEGDNKGNDTFSPKTNEGRTFNNLTVYRLDNAFVDNTASELDSGFRKLKLEFGGQTYSVKEFDTYSRYLIKLSGSVKYKFDAPEEGYYKLNFTGVRDFKEDGERLSVRLNGKSYVGMVKRDEGNTSLISLYNYHSLSNIMEEVDYVELKKTNMISIRSEKEVSDIYLDTLVINSNINSVSRSNIFQNKELYANIDNMYMINDHHVKVNEKMNKYSYRERFFNNVKTYSHEDFEYKIKINEKHSKDPITDIKLMNDPEMAFKLVYDLYYNDKINNEEGTAEVQDVFDPKLLMVNEKMDIRKENDNTYLVFKPFLFQSYLFEHINFGKNAVKKNKNVLVSLDGILDFEYLHKVDVSNDEEFTEFLKTIKSVSPIDLIRLMNAFGIIRSQYS